LDAGADDYVGKPFEMAEVEARLRALVRRSAGADDVVVIGRLKLDRRARRIFCDELDWPLPAREYEVLVELLSPLGRVVSKKMLSDKLSSSDDALGDNALESFISRLRKRMAGTGAAIVTVRGLGYRVQQEVVFDA
jgi:DNA-binding response OmpR family regulator